MTNTASAQKKKKRLSMHQKQSLAGWAFLMPATLLIFIMSFYPMFSALLTSFKRGKPTALVWSEPLWRNYQFMLKDKVFIQSVTNTLTYLIIQVPIMLILAVIFASLLNNRDLKFRGLFRTCIFLPCATGLVAYSMIFRTLFTYDGMVNNMLLKFGLISEAINWLNDPVYAKAVIIIGLVWRWTGYNMVFYLSAMQSIDYSIYEAARIDGANSLKILFYVTIPNIKNSLALCALLRTIDSFRLFDKVNLLTGGGPANSTSTITQYLYNYGIKSLDFGFGSAGAIVMTVLVLLLSSVYIKRAIS